MSLVEQLIFGKPYVALLLPLSLLMPALIKHWSLKAWLLIPLQFIVGIVLPMTWFLLSVELVPDWKGGATLGWLSCFVVGKLWLLPLVLWALAAFYARVIWKSSKPLHPWIVLGYAVGALVSSLCLLQGLLCLSSFIVHVWPFAVPIGVTIYYVRTAWRLTKERAITPLQWWGGIITSSPLFGVSVWQSMEVFQKLPENPPSCFIVTAAMRGHASIVGPWIACTRHGKPRVINRQLITFWAFEETWKERHPRSHCWFRRIYNRLGPQIAQRLSNRWLADTVYLALKPAEWLTRWFIEAKAHQTAPNRADR